MKTVTIVLCGVVFCGAAVGWLTEAIRLPGRTGHGSSRDAIDPPTLTTTPAGIVRGPGYVEPASEMRRLVFKVDGVIQKCNFEIGSHVKAGDVLVSLCNEEEIAAVAVAEQDLALATAERGQLLSGINRFRIAAAESKVEMLRDQL